MDNIKVKVVKTHPDAVLPTANNKEAGTGDTGFDLVAVDQVSIPVGSSAIVPVGLTLADITPGYWIRIEPRSGLGFKHSLQPHLGVIDNGYRGDLAVKMYNFHDMTDALIKKGDKIAQLVVYKLHQPTFEFVDEVTHTNRGAKGFGSSDNPKPPPKDLTRVPFSVKRARLPTETTSEGSSNIINLVNSEGEVDYDMHEDVNPWEFHNVQSLLDWAKSRRDVVDDDYFADLLSNTIANRDRRKLNTEDV